MEPGMYIYRILSIARSGARYFPERFTSANEAVEYANVKQYNANVHYDEHTRSFNPEGFHYIVERHYYDNSDAEVVYCTRTER